eukprot:s1688_g3.t2
MRSTQEEALRPPAEELRMLILRTDMPWPSRPQALASLTLPIVALEQVIRTHGAVAYPEEVAALVKALSVSTAHGASFAYRSEGRSNLGVRLHALQNHPGDYEYLQSAVLNKASSIATAGEWADSVSLQALSNATGAEIRVWAFDAKLKRCKSSKVLWLVLEAWHSRWLRPLGADRCLDACLSSEVQIINLDGAGPALQGGAPKSDVASYCGRLLGLLRWWYA